jgi:hypothetical protein
MDEPFDPNVILKAVYSLCRIGNGRETQVAVDLLLWEVEDMLRHGRFADVDRILDKADPKQMDAGVQLALWTVTYHGKTHLKKREDFVRRSEPDMVERLGEERALRLLATRK